MAKRSFHQTNWTPTGQADTTALTSGTYMALKGASATQLIDILEIMISGLAGVSSPTLMQMARVTTLEVPAGGSALAAPASDGPMHPATAVLAAPPIPFTAAATTGPQRSAATTDAKLELNLNAFGGIVRWVYSPTEQWSQLGNTASLGESVLSAFNAGTVGAVSAHIVYEPY